MTTIVATKGAVLMGRPPRVGRTTRYDEPLSERVPVLFTPTQLKSIDDHVGRADMSAFIREAALREVENGSPLKLTLRRGAPCGEWQVVNDHDDSEPFEISAHLARLWGAIEGDELLETRGASMVDAGIPAHAFLLMRPFLMRSPNPGQVCAIVATMEDGLALGTVKSWEWGNRVYALTEGAKKELKLPPDAIEIRALSGWTGHLIS